MGGPTSKHSLWHLLHGLSNTQICQYLFGTAQDGVKLVRAVELLHHAAHSCLCDASSTKDVDGIIGDIVCTPSRVGLQQTNRATQQLRLSRIVHVIHLVGDGLQPGLTGFGQRDHFGNLLTYDRLGDQGLAKHDTLMCPFEALLHNGTHPSNHGAGHGPTFMVEVAHDDDESIVFFAQEVVDGNFDVVELDEAGGRRGRVRCLDFLDFNIFISWDYND